MADHASMRVANHALVLAALKALGPTSRSEIARVTGLAKPTVSTIVDDLLETDVALDLGIGASTQGGGRPPKVVAFNPKSNSVVGVHIGVHRTTVVLCDAVGDEVARWSGDTERDVPAEVVLAHIAEAARRLLAENPAAADALIGVGVCVPGLVRAETGVCALAPNLGWVDVPVSDIMQDELGAPVQVRNTAQMCAMAEALEGSAVGSRHMALVYAGGGIGAGVIAGGQIYQGADGMAGELGHCSIPDNDLLCGCGKVGCLETRTSGSALAAQLGVAGPGERGEIDRVVDAAVAGDDAAVEAVVAAARLLGWAAAWIVNLFDPSTIVLGGGLAEAGAIAVVPFSEALRSNVLSASAGDLEIVPWALGHSAKTRGAVLVALQAADSGITVDVSGRHQ